MNRFLQVFYIIFSATLLSLAIPNELFHFGSPFIAIISMISFYYAYINFKSYKESLLLTGLHTFTVHIMSSFWLAFFKDFAVLTLGASALGTGVIGCVIGLILYSPFAKINKHKELRMYSSPLYNSFISFRVLWFSCVYVLYEWIKSCGWLGYPWGTISSAMYRWKILIQIADITGTYGITFLVILFNAIVTEGFVLYFKSKNDTKTIYAAKNFIRISNVWRILFILSFVYGCFKYFKPIEPIKYLNTIMVQQNADPWKETNDSETILLSERLTREKIEEVKKSGTNVDLVVWSEGCLKYSFPNSYFHYQNFPIEEPLIPFIKEMNIPFILGGPFTESYSPRKIFNSALLFDKEGNFRGAYGKNHLVPLAEVIPFSNIPFVASFLKKVIGISAGWTPGDQYVYFDIKGNLNGVNSKPITKVISLADSVEEQKKKDELKSYVRISTPICFDDAFPDVCRPLVSNGSEVFINLTDDSWSKTKSAEYQHFVISAYRSIEYRTTLARSTNAGYSVIVDPKGNILSDMPLFEQHAMFSKIPIYNNQQTIYLRFGNLLPHIIAILVIIFEIYLFLTLNKRSEAYSERKKFKKQKKHHKK